jgi:hypothetical protein
VNDTPWKSSDTVVTSDTVEKAQVRHEAIKAMKAGRATPEQRALVEDLDSVLQKAAQTRRK